jgi:hypothetical protein
VPVVMGLAFTVLFRIAIPEALPSDRGTDPRPQTGKVADGVLDLNAKLHRCVDGTQRTDGRTGVATTSREYGPCRVMAS